MLSPTCTSGGPANTSPQDGRPTTPQGQTPRQHDECARDADARIAVSGSRPTSSVLTSAIWPPASPVPRQESVTSGTDCRLHQPPPVVDGSRCTNASSTAEVN